MKAGDAIFTLVAPETVWVLAHIDESRSGAIAEGQPAQIRLRSQPLKEFNGKVVRIGIESDRVSEERRVWVDCANCPDKFHLGEQAEVLITVGRIAKGIFVPEAAVHGYDGRKGVVLAVEQGRLKRREISFAGRTEDARLEVAGEFPAGVAIVVEALPLAAEGRAARAKE